MGFLSVEIKARCSNPARIRAILKAHKARLKGLDHQIDTYFCVPSGRSASRTGQGSALFAALVNTPDLSGRLKLREGNIENALIYYTRDNQKNSKKCDATLFPCEKGTPLKRVLSKALGVLAVVDKMREIYFIKNAKFHIDRVKNLGSFVEIEIFDRKRNFGEVKLRKQCEFYQVLLEIQAKDLVADSYSDLMLKSG